MLLAAPSGVAWCSVHLEQPGSTDVVSTSIGVGFCCSVDWFMVAEIDLSCSLLVVNGLSDFLGELNVKILTYGLEDVSKRII